MKKSMNQRTPTYVENNLFYVCNFVTIFVIIDMLQHSQIRMVVADGLGSYLSSASIINIHLRYRKFGRYQILSISSIYSSMKDIPFD